MPEVLQHSAMMSLRQPTIFSCSSRRPFGWVVAWRMRLTTSSPNGICGFVRAATASSRPLTRSIRNPTTVVVPMSNAIAVIVAGRVARLERDEPPFGGDRRHVEIPAPDDRRQGPQRAEVELHLRPAERVEQPVRVRALIVQRRRRQRHVLLGDRRVERHRPAAPVGEDLVLEEARRDRHVHAEFLRRRGPAGQPRAALDARPS